MISPNGYWIGPEAESQHKFDPHLATALTHFFKNEDPSATIVDLGCGMGNYVQHFRANGLRADGFDGNPYTPTLTSGICEVTDLSIPFVFQTKYDWVMSLEVGEHLPPQFETIFLENLDRNNTKGIILSWAIEGQGGHGHVNERNNDYIYGRLEALGYKSDRVAEFYLRQHAELGWFKNTVMVFRRH
jgi:SAM-dependent methyltransferase